ncbi:conserved Plasmodium protein, unknown function [Plasmodium gallinaceum]|uniref:Uncharacterized protein n=1 Tax=Plasmodium gallinaceum TaxID=5849 RepID=A0A1J1GXB1_PLAGA|nr:conserved Plasmodium protein, unknown function [Plasmodium gallinaceum]CRG95933.1 conserved Plasmodium protein, unknown function [Plasmodium gallinaceum]
MNNFQSKLNKKYSSKYKNKQIENKNKRKLLQLRNGHFRRIVDNEVISKNSSLPLSCTCICATPRTEENNIISSNGKINNRYNSSERSEKFENKEQIDKKSYFSKNYNKVNYVDELNSDKSEKLQNEKTIDHPSIGTISDISFTQTSKKSDDNASIIGEIETEKENKYSASSTENEEEKEKIEKKKKKEKIEEKKKEKIEEKEKEKIEEKEKEKIEDESFNDDYEFKDDIKEDETKNKGDTSNDNKLIPPSKTLMKGIKANIYFLSNKEMVEVLMCYNYNCNALIFEKDNFLRYLYLKSINNFILNERMIEGLCNKENIKYVLACNSIVIESSDFLKPLIVEFASSMVKKIFVKHMKLTSQQQWDMKKYNEYLEELDPSEKLRLRKVERFHSYNMLVTNN